MMSHKHVNETERALLTSQRDEIFDQSRCCMVLCICPWHTSIVDRLQAWIDDTKLKMYHRPPKYEILYKSRMQPPPTYNYEVNATTARQMSDERGLEEDQSRSPTTRTGHASVPAHTFQNEQSFLRENAVSRDDASLSGTRTTLQCVVVEVRTIGGRKWRPKRNVSGSSVEVKLFTTLCPWLFWKDTITSKCFFSLQSNTELYLTPGRRNRIKIRSGVFPAVNSAADQRIFKQVYIPLSGKNAIQHVATQKYVGRDSRYRLTLVQAQFALDWTVAIIY